MPRRLDTEEKRQRQIDREIAASMQAAAWATDALEPDEPERSPSAAASRRWYRKNLKKARATANARMRERYKDPEVRAKKVEYQRRRRINDAERIKTVEDAAYDRQKEKARKRKERAAKDREQRTAETPQDREHRLEMRRRWRAANREALNEKKRAWCAQNPEKVRDAKARHLHNKLQTDQLCSAHKSDKPQPH